MKNKHTGLIDASWEENGEGHIITCGKCGEKQNIFITKNTGFVEELDFICSSCGERNTISSY